MTSNTPLKPWRRRARIAEIHEIAARQLEEPEVEFEIAPYLEELRAMETRPRAFEDVEARIMLLLGARAKPTRLKRLLKQLRERRVADGDLPLFEDFEAALRQRTGSSVLLGHDFAPETFSELDHGVVWGDVGSAIAALGELTQSVFLNSGTLLGVVRDKRLIDHDDDVDLGFLLKAGSASEAVTEWLALGEELTRRGLLQESVRSEPEIYKLKSTGAYEIDLFPVWIEDGKVFVFPHTCGELTESEVFPLKTCEVTGLSIPAEPEKMLALNYGPDWKTPDPYFKFPWHKAIQRFATFRDGVRGATARDRRKTVLTYGTFDLFHIGHVRLLRRLSEMGDRLIVACSTDEFNAIKGKTCVMPYAERAEVLRACNYVSEVIAENDWAQKRADIQEHDVDIFAMGDDWAGKFDDLADLCEVVYLPRTENVSTTDLKKRVHEQNLEPVNAGAS